MADVTERLVAAFDRELNAMTAELSVEQIPGFTGQVKSAFATLLADVALTSAFKSKPPVEVRDLVAKMLFEAATEAANAATGKRGGE